MLQISTSIFAKNLHLMGNLHHLGLVTNDFSPLHFDFSFWHIELSLVSMILNIGSI